MPKNAKFFYCEICDFISNKLSEYKRHIGTKKHKSTENQQNQQEKCQSQQEKCHRTKKCQKLNKIPFQTFCIYENGQFINIQKCPF